MFNIEGKNNTAICYAKTIEESAIGQIRTLCDIEAFKDSKIRIAPDAHTGIGCTIGTTMTIKDKVIPNTVGVDIGCVDRDTEVLTPKGWIKICDYTDEQILLYDYSTDTAYFDYPNLFIKKKCKEFYHFSNSKNLDQTFFAEHHVLVYSGRKSEGFKLHHYKAEELWNKLKSLKSPSYYAKTCFNTAEKGVPYSDDIIRLFVAISADARLRPLVKGNYYIETHFKKVRKIERLKLLLERANIPYKQHTATHDNSVYITFNSFVLNTKDLTQFYLANKHQLEVICDEVIKWDGTHDVIRDHKMFITTNKKNADFVQYAFSAIGIRSSIYCYVDPKHNKKDCYYVLPTKNEYVIYKNDNTFMYKVESQDGYKYCFNSKTDAFVIRHNNKISVTGNCGIEVVKLSKKSTATLDFNKLDKVIHSFVPSGMNVHVAKNRHRFSDEIDLSELRCYKHIKEDRALLSIGTLGSGNHYSEVDIDENKNYFLTIHSGSRHLGVEIAEYYQEQAFNQLRDKKQSDIDDIIEVLKKQGKECEIENAIIEYNKNALPDNMLKYLAWVEGSLFDDYIHDMEIAQHFARLNRKAIADIIMKELKLKEEDSFTTIHNYIDTENMILRKGAVSAQSGEKLIIPINMRDGSLICIGKGNPDWNYSAPHGAGRLMSRTDAKNSISMSKYKQDMKGIFTTSVKVSTVDEAPDAYKPMEEIVEAITPTVEIVSRLKPVYNFKAS